MRPVIYGLVLATIAAGPAMAARAADPFGAGEMFRLR
jgi:hypothetical protein